MRHLGKGGAQVVGIGVGGLGIDQGDGRIARRRFAPRTAWVAKHLALQHGEVGQVLVDKTVARAAKPAQTVFDVGGIAGLAHLAVVDQINPCLGLQAHHLSHRLANARLQSLRLHGHAAFFGKHHLDQVIGPGQAAGVRGQKSVCAALHADALAWMKWRYCAASASLNCRPSQTRPHLFSVLALGWGKSRHIVFCGSSANSRLADWQT